MCAKLNVRFGHALGKFPFQNFDAIHPDLKTLPLVGKHFANALPIRRAIPAELRGLGEPTTGKQAWDAIRSLALQANAAGIKQVSVALASNAKGFVATVNQIHRLHNADRRQGNRSWLLEDFGLRPALSNAHQGLGRPVGRVLDEDSRLRNQHPVKGGRFGDAPPPPPHQPSRRIPLPIGISSDRQFPGNGGMWQVTLVTVPLGMVVLHNLA